MSMTTESRRTGITQFVILAMSTFLLGLYFGHDLPNGVDLITLQTGLIGVMAFLSLNHLSRITGHSGVELNSVERRLQRYVDSQGHIHRFDEAEDLRRRSPNMAEEAAVYGRQLQVSER